MMGLLAQLLRDARRLADDTCRHQPRCPDASVMPGRGLHRDIRLHRHPCTCRLTTTRSGSAGSPGCCRGAGSV